MKCRWLYFNIGVGNLNCPYDVKVCTKCGKLLVACEMNFRKAKRGKYGFRGECKICEQQYNKKYMKQYYEKNKEELLEKNKIHYEKNKEQIAEKNKIYRENNKEQIAKQRKQYRENNKEQIAENLKQWHKKNPHIAFNNRNKRRQLEENQGRGITKEQWYEMFCFFNWECAYSGIQLNENNRTIDHIIALNNRGLNEIWNCVPCYDSYNYSKNTKDMEIWYRQQEYFSEERLAKIYEWCEYAYNKWGIVED